jgi:hypothetical protein
VVNPSGLLERSVAGDPLDSAARDEHHPGTVVDGERQDYGVLVTSFHNRPKPSAWRWKS